MVFIEKINILIIVITIQNIKIIFDPIFKIEIKTIFIEK